MAAKKPIAKPSRTSTAKKAAAPARKSAPPPRHAQPSRKSAPVASPSVTSVSKTKSKPVGAQVAPAAKTAPAASQRATQPANAPSAAAASAAAESRPRAAVAAMPARASGGVVATAVHRTPPSAAPLAPDIEDGDDSAGLLAGPRNVQPYIAKRGEQYMGKQQLDHFRVILNGWKRDLMEEVDRTVSHMKDEASNFPDPNDRATQEEEFSLELRTRDRERKLIRKIDEAIKRIDDGSYGYCLETGEEIGIKRLEARPVATLSIEAQERRERREKQFGDRDDRYR